MPFGNPNGDYIQSTPDVFGKFNDKGNNILGSSVGGTGGPPASPPPTARPPTAIKSASRRRN